MDMTDGAQLSQWIEEELGAEVVDRSQVNSLATAWTTPGSWRLCGRVG
jgi:hypothetical protein